MILTEDECFAALADDITEIEETRACEEEWTVIVAMCRAIEAAVIARLAQGVDMPEAVNNDLADDISAIDAMYRGDPTYEHDAYYMRKAAEKCVRKGYALYTADQLHTCIAAARVKAINECASELDGMKCNNKTATQPERAPLSDAELEQEFCKITGLETGINPAAADTKRALVWFKKGYAHGIKQGGQHD